VGPPDPFTFLFVVGIVGIVDIVDFREVVVDVVIVVDVIVDVDVDVVDLLLVLFRYVCLWLPRDSEIVV